METRQDQEQIERLLREANVLRMRGQASEAEERCRAALEWAPEDPSALEMLGDLQRGRGQLEEAASLFQRAMAAAPQRASPEIKFAEITLELAERQHQRDVATLLLQQPGSQDRQRRNVWAALFFSGLFPGLGQFYNREPLKGGLLVGGGLVCLGMGGASLIQLLFTVMSARSHGQVDSFSAWFGFLAFVLWLYSVIDAVVVAQRRGRVPSGSLGG